MAPPESPAQRTSPLTPEELRQLHAVQLELLAEFDRICARLQLPYQIAAGTLLGAVRHGGFIPWDDDVDVIMRRADYERLLDEAPALLGEMFFLQCWRTDPGFQQFFAKLRRHGSRFRQVGEREAMHHGIFLDIFPLDAVAPDRRRWRFRYSCLRGSFTLVSALRRLALHPDKGNLSSAHPAWRQYLGPWLQRGLAVVPWWFWPAILDRLLRSMAALTDDRLTCLASGWMTMDRVRQLNRPVAEWEQTVLLPFEGRLLPATACYEQALARLYGDYRTPPPPDRRHPGHPVVEFALPASGERRA
jgi:lipopolysaccharide cholinephosphotransferase